MSHNFIHQINKTYKRKKTYQTVNKPITRKKFGKPKARKSEETRKKGGKPNARKSEERRKTLGGRTEEEKHQSKKTKTLKEDKTK